LLRKLDFLSTNKFSGSAIANPLNGWGLKRGKPSEGGAHAERDDVPVELPLDARGVENGVRILGIECDIGPEEIAEACGDEDRVLGDAGGGFPAVKVTVSV
jgi:hypothetical protein